MIRGKHGPLPSLRLEDHGFNLFAIRDWRAAEFDAGRPNGLGDFYAAHGLCFDCRSEGVQIVEWRSPIDRIDVERAAALGIEKVPIYERCSTCGGSGKANRSQWKQR